MKDQLKSKKILAIIPARGGSKGLPKKNIKILGGKPLIALTIEAALSSGVLNRVIISTEDEEIRDISKKYGGEVLLRPKELAGDGVVLHRVIEHVILHLRKNENYKPDVVVLLQPTSPLRTAEDINQALEIFLSNECESVIGVYEPSHPLHWSFKQGKKHLKAAFGIEHFRKQRQDLPKFYIPNGSIFISTLENLLKYESFYTKKVLPYVMSAEKSVDVNNEVEFMLAELLINKLNECKKNK